MAVTLFTEAFKWTYGLLVIAELEERRIQKVKLSDDEAAAVSVNICWLAAGRSLTTWTISNECKILTGGQGGRLDSS